MLFQNEWSTQSKYLFDFAQRFFCRNDSIQVQIKPFVRIDTGFILLHRVDVAYHRDYKTKSFRAQSFGHSYGTIRQLSGQFINLI